MDELTSECSQGGEGTQNTTKQTTPTRGRQAIKGIHTRKTEAGLSDRHTRRLARRLKRNRPGW